MTLSRNRANPKGVGKSRANEDPAPLFSLTGRNRANPKGVGKSSHSTIVWSGTIMKLGRNRANPKGVGKSVAIGVIAIESLMS